MKLNNVETFHMPLKMDELIKFGGSMYPSIVGEMADLLRTSFCEDEQVSDVALAHFFGKPSEDGEEPEAILVETLSFCDGGHAHETLEKFKASWEYLGDVHKNPRYQNFFGGSLSIWADGILVVLWFTKEEVAPRLG